MNSSGRSVREIHGRKDSQLEISIRQIVTESRLFLLERVNAFFFLFLLFYNLLINHSFA